MKKERYFTPESIDEKAGQMDQDVAGLRKRHPVSLSYDRAALLVLDMQRYFLEEGSHAFIPSAPAIVPNIQKLLEISSAKRIPVIFTRHTNTETDAGMMARWWQDLIRPENGVSDIIGQLDPSVGTVIEKHQYDAFHQTDLERILHERGVSQVIICGVMTHLCCESTARAAFVRGFEVFLAIDGTASYLEPFHRATLWNAVHGFAVPMLTRDLIDKLGG